MIRFLSTAALAFTLGYTGNSLSAAEIGVTDSQMLFGQAAALDGPAHPEISQEGQRGPRLSASVCRTNHRFIVVTITAQRTCSPSQVVLPPERHGEPHQATAVGSLC